MKPASIWSSTTKVLGGGLLALCCASIGRSSDPQVTAVYSRTFYGYHRQRAAGGGYEPETYTFANGGRWDDSESHRDMASLPFLKVAQVVAGPLGARQYVSSLDPKKIKLVIFVYWGTTSGQDDVNADNRRGIAEGLHLTPPVAETRGGGQGFSYTALAMIDLMNELRDRNDAHNAAILGFGDAWRHAKLLPFFANSEDTINDLEETRYFVVLKAFDFQLAASRKQWKMLWVTRFSIAEHGRQFEDVVDKMTQSAGWAFGTDSKGLVQRHLEGEVHVGVPKVVGPSPAQ